VILLRNSDATGSGFASSFSCNKISPLALSRGVSLLFPAYFQKCGAWSPALARVPSFALGKLSAAQRFKYTSFPSSAHPPKTRLRPHSSERNQNTSITSRCTSYQVRQALSCPLPDRFSRDTDLQHIGLAVAVRIRACPEKIRASPLHQSIRMQRGEAANRYRRPIQFLIPHQNVAPFRYIREHIRRTQNRTRCSFTCRNLRIQKFPNDRAIFLAIGIWPVSSATS